MRYILVLALLFLIHQFCLGQNLRRWDVQIDSLQNQLEKASTDSVKISTARGLIDILINKGWTMTNLGQFAIAYQSYGRAFELWEAPEMEKLFTQNGEKGKVEKWYWSRLANLNFNYGHLMKVTGNNDEQQFYYQKAYQIASQWDDVLNTVYALSGMAYIHLKNGDLDSAQINMVKVNSIPPEIYNYDGYSDLLFIDGTIKLKSAQFEDAKKTFLKGAKDASGQTYVVGIATNNLGLSMTYRNLNAPDSSLYYGKASLGILRRIREIQMFDIDIATAYDNLYQHFLHFDQPDSAFKYLEIAHQEKAILTDQKIANLAAFQQVLLESERRVKVLLNILNNAFYTVTSKFIIHHSLFEIQELPKVTIQTKNLEDKIEISISDNGPGIPDSIKDKIFQPFFTTKPTGQGTGLGLSLSYDIVKAHGGEIKVISKEGEGTEFIIQLSF